MMLSRTAENLYWLGRHLERADAVSRIIKQHTKLLVDLPIEVESDWGSLLAITGASDTYIERYSAADELGIVSHLMADIANPTSIIRTVSAARENLRVTRQLMPRSVTECVNRLHSTVANSAGNCTARNSRLDLCDNIIAASQQIVGTMASTISRDDVFSFYELGRNVERADMTTRVLEVRASSLLSDGSSDARPPADRSPYEDVRWLGVLRSLGAEHMYTRSSTGSIAGESVVEFLIDDPRFPKSVTHCVTRIEQILGGLPTRHKPVDQCIKIEKIVRDRPSGTLDAPALQEWVDRMQVGIAGFHDSVTAAFFIIDHSHGRSHPSHPTGRVVV